MRSNNLMTLRMKKSTKAPLPEILLQITGQSKYNITVLNVNDVHQLGTVIFTPIRRLLVNPPHTKLQCDHQKVTIGKRSCKLN